jgi:hypothetical protein
MPRPSHSPWFDHPNNVWREVPVTNRLQPFPQSEI